MSIKRYGRLRGLYEPQPVSVQAGPRGVPVAVDGRAVETINEDWVVEDLWWTGEPVRRRYFELVLANGSNVVVFEDLTQRRWFSQRD